MTIRNLYQYQTLTNAYTILKFHIPVSLYSCFRKSNRKETLLITPKLLSDSFIYSASSLWNIFRTCPEGFLTVDFAVGIGCMKSRCKDWIFQRQEMGDKNMWYYDINFILR